MKTIKSRKTKQIVQIIDKQKEEIRYLVFPNSDQYKIVKEILFKGFTKLPSGFYRDGYGLARPAGAFLLRALSEGLGGRMKLTIVKDGENSISPYRKNIQKVALRYADFWELMTALREITAERNSKSRILVAARLGLLFPSHFPAVDKDIDTPYSYSEDKFAKIINSEDDIATKLTKEDVAAIVELYNDIISKNLVGRKRRDIKILAKGKAITQRVYLEKVIELFEEQITKAHTSESSWQLFLRDFILLFNTSYVAALEKLSISLGGKYPDFVLIDVYNYVDIYEIKKPETNLLKLDQSRGNYYWDTELAKAISQTENYIDLLNRNSFAFIAETRKISPVPIKVVRPRGYIVAGKSEQLTDPKKQDDFRLLANSLKNITVILYDELLSNLKNLVTRLEVEAEAKS